MSATAPRRRKAPCLRNFFANATWLSATTLQSAGSSAHRDGRIPPPDFHKGRIPFWTEKTLDESDRAAVLASRLKTKAAA
jgi:hypothetical protein